MGVQAGSIPVLYINRRADRARRAAFLAHARRQSLAPRRIDAVDREDPAALAAHAGLLPATFWGGRWIKPGAFACFLSHRRAWAQAARGAGWTLICEDDADLIVGRAEILAEAAQAEEEGLDLLFCGARIAAWAAAGGRAASCGGARPLAPADRASALRLALSLKRREGLGLSRGPGAEALLVSTQGARGLLACTAQEGCVAGVDWLALRCADCGMRRPAAPELRLLERLHGPLRHGLRGGLSSRPLASLRGVPSVLAHRVRLPIDAVMQGNAEDDASGVAPPDRAGYTACRSTRSSAG